jgi:hypothetical protein
LALSLSPAEHVRILHPPQRRGIVTVAQRRDGWHESRVPVADLPAFVVGKMGAPDLFVSQQSFFGWRCIAQLAQLGAAYVDLDYHKTLRWADSSPECVTEAVLRTLEDVPIPTPSCIFFTGRGLLALWLHDLVPRAALPRWMPLQRQLAMILASFGADPCALDAARVFRLAGTENSRSGTIVRPTYLAAEPGQLWRWDFEDLTDEVLPAPRAEIVSLRARRAETHAHGRGLGSTRHLTITTYAETVLTDLQRLRQLRWSGPIPPGQRDIWLFLAAGAMAWLAPPAVLRREMHALAREAAAWDERETNSRMSSVLRPAARCSHGRDRRVGRKANRSPLPVPGRNHRGAARDHTGRDARREPAGSGRSRPRPQTRRRTSDHLPPAPWRPGTHRVRGGLRRADKALGGRGNQSPNLVSSSIRNRWHRSVTVYGGVAHKQASA